MARSTGSYEIASVAGENVRAFVPEPLPPKDPPLQISGDIGELVTSAEANLARLNSAGSMVSSLDWFVYAFVRKEAVVSSQIEGTQASLTDLLTSEADAPTPAAPDHVEEICNYLVALKFARDQLKKEGGLPLSTRLLNGAHQRLMSGARGQHQQPGKLRKSQNWIGGTRPGNARFVPPPPHRVPDLLSQLEAYLNSPAELSPVVRAGLAHAQFETIHPYLDGNGRVGRLLITLCLEEWELLAEPLLYLSLFFKRHRQEYYDRLGAIRVNGDWEGWLAYYLEGVTVIAEESLALIKSLFAILGRDRAAYLDSDRATVMGARIFEGLPQNPIVTVKSAAKQFATTKPTANKAILSLCDAGILEEISGRSRDRTFAYRTYLDLLKEGTELGD